MTNIAYLVLAHNQPAQLARLVERLNQPNVWFYIHVDKKSADKKEIVNLFTGYQNVTVVSEYSVNWMGFKMVESTLLLLRLAYSSDVDFKYYVLMSGQDYPIKSNNYINDFFTRHSEDFISFAPINEAPDNYKNKVRYFHYYDFPYSNPRSAKKAPLLVYLYYGIHKHVMRYLPRRRFYKGMEPYFGSQWFTLTSDTVKYILEFTKANKGYLRFMKYTEGPDETFFHTIILNSERRTNVFDYPRYEVWHNKKNEQEQFIQEYSSLRYMDWSDRGKNIPKPAVLDDSYFNELKNSPDLFARKFDEKISASLMARIDAEWLKKA